jgi:hypothetical protein
MATIQDNAMRVLWFLETKSVIKTQRRYRTQHRKDAFRRWIQQFIETDCVSNRKEGEELRISKQGVDRIQEAFTQLLQKSDRRVSLQLDIQYTTVWKVANNRLHPLAYKVRIVQVLKPKDNPCRF